MVNNKNSRDSEDGKMIENYFFIDYENVNKDGMNGVAGLGNNDTVRIYYSTNADTMTFGMHRRIAVSKAVFEYVKVDLSIKNAVDCKILFDLEDISKNKIARNYYIVSKDTDFDKPINQIKAKGVNLFRITSICNYKEGKSIPDDENNAIIDNNSKEKKRECQVRTFFGQHFKDKVYTEKKTQIITAILESDNKSVLNNKLQKIYSGTEVKKILKELKPLIEDMPTH